MNNILLLQLIISFIIGGSFVALLSLIAERVSSRFAGIILAFPSTIAIGFFFLGWTLSPQAAAKIVPATLLSLGFSVLYPIIYVYSAIWCSKFISSKIQQIIFCFSISTLFWLVLSLPIVILKINNLALGIVGYIVLALLAHVLFSTKKENKSSLQPYTLKQKIYRSAFIGLIIALAVFFGKTFGSFWGGAFATFPAAFSSSLIILHWYYEPQKLFSVVRKVPLGSLSLCTYLLTVMIAFPLFGFVFGTIIAYCVSLITTIILLKIQRQQEKS